MLSILVSIKTYGFQLALLDKFRFQALSLGTGGKSNEFVLLDREIRLRLHKDVFQQDTYYSRGVIKNEVCGLRSSVGTIAILDYSWIVPR